MTAAQLGMGHLQEHVGGDGDDPSRLPRAVLLYCCTLETHGGQAGKMGSNVNVRSSFMKINENTVLSDNFFLLAPRLSEGC